MNTVRKGAPPQEDDLFSIGAVTQMTGIAKATLRVPLACVVCEVIGPTMSAIGARWSAGRVEHALTERILPWPTAFWGCYIGTTRGEASERIHRLMLDLNVLQI